MDRAEAEIGGAERAGVRGRLAGIRIGADAEVLARAKGVELGREAPAARTAGDVARLPASCRRRDERRLGACAAGVDGKTVIPRREPRQRQRRSVWAGDRRCAAFARRAALVDEAPRHGGDLAFEAQRNLGRPIGPDRRERRHEAIAQPLDPGETFACLRFRAGLEAEARQDRLARLDRRVDWTSEGIDIAAGDADEAGDPIDQGVALAHRGLGFQDGAGPGPQAHGLALRQAGVGPQHARPGGDVEGA